MSEVSLLEAINTLRPELPAADARVAAVLCRARSYFRAVPLDMLDIVTSMLELRAPHELARCEAAIRAHDAFMDRYRAGHDALSRNKLALDYPWVSTMDHVIIAWSSGTPIVRASAVAYSEDACGRAIGAGLVATTNVALDNVLPCGLRIYSIATRYSGEYPGYVLLDPKNMQHIYLESGSYDHLLNDLGEPMPYHGAHSLRVLGYRHGYMVMSLV